MLENLPKSAYFHCKKFKVRHDIAALKVTTEALVFGGFLANNPTENKLLLEIGTGCGILPLMIAQKNESSIHSVEIDENAFELAFENVQNSIFKHQIGVFHVDIQLFSPDTGVGEPEKYDLIFSNPPFFQNHLKGKSDLKNLAKHNDSLPFHVLAHQVKRFLNHEGSFWVLLPPFELSLLEKHLNEIGLVKTQEIYIQQQQKSKVLRIIATFAFVETPYSKMIFSIKNHKNEYSNQFKALLKDYYLIF